MELRDLNSFIRVAKLGSLSKAAKVYDIPKATLSNHLRRLEDNLGVELFVRRNNKLKLTVSGHEMVKQCENIFAACETATNSLQNIEKELAGPFSIAASSELGTSVVGPIIQHFAADHPQLNIRVDITQCDSFFNDEMDIDCVIYTGQPPDSSLIGKKLGEFTYSMYASPNYLKRNGVPESCDNLKDYSGLLYVRNNELEHWLLKSGKKTIDFTPPSRIHINDYWLLKSMAVREMGIAYLPSFFVANEIRTNALTLVKKGWHSDPVPIYALYPKQRHKSRKIQNFVDYWIENFDRLNRNPPYTLVN
ncbi:LysR family transcriptional regulator [Dasania marina]|uniref:LysR family transcriptional regulator n=1 Tax=Dasania marina TaxID=471499 RepID=UPI0030D91804|tara:strand:+ start:46523 stop:47440 length:918 start_codon:yes stop_codon:yes gene_type:complete